MDSKAPYSIRWEVVRSMLTDQSHLEEIANIPSTVQCDAIKRLTDQNLLQKFATHESSTVRTAAINAITNQDFIADIARSDPDGYVREEAMRKLPAETRVKIPQELCGKGIHYFAIPWITGHSNMHPDHDKFFCKYCNVSNGKPFR